MVTIDIEQDNRPRYILYTRQDEYILQNVTKLQNHTKLKLDVYADDGSGEKLIMLKPLDAVVFEVKVTCRFPKTFLNSQVGAW